MTETDLYGISSNHADLNMIDFNVSKVTTKQYDDNKLNRLLRYTKKMLIMMIFIS